MERTTHELPLVARQPLVERVLDRLQRPNDVRDSPKDFLRPGFYGLAGVGKSRLLAEIVAGAQTITPYVVSVDFDSPTAPTTPFDFVDRVITNLEMIEKESRQPWQRLAWSRQNPFRACRAVTNAIEQARAQSSHQSIDAHNSHIENVNIINDTGQSHITAELRRALDEALPHLCQKRTPKDQYGRPNRTPRPLIVLVLDTVEMAARPLSRWLEAELDTLWAGNRLGYHLLTVAASRQRVDRWTETELPPLSEAESVTFVRDYVFYRHGQQPLIQKILTTFREDTPTRQSLVHLGDGIPLLLGLLCDTVIEAPALLANLEAMLPKAHEERIRYVVARYLEQLAEAAHRQNDARLWERYHLLLAAALPRRLSGVALLRALLSDLEGTPFAAAYPLRRPMAAPAQRTFCAARWERAALSPDCASGTVERDQTG